MEKQNKPSTIERWCEEYYRCHSHIWNALASLCFILPQWERIVFDPIQEFSACNCSQFHQQLFLCIPSAFWRKHNLDNFLLHFLRIFFNWGLEKTAGRCCI